jgi:geranylgeranyl reductase family protein
MNGAARTFDVAIVGAGPAGATTALALLAERPDLRVAIFDRAALPRTKPCGGAISRPGIEALAALDATPTALGVAHVPIRAIRVRHRDRSIERTIGTDRDLGVVVERAVFDAALAREAERRGARLFEGHRLVGLAGDALTFATAGGEVLASARIVVGADGTGSAVRRLAGFREHARRARLLVTETEPSPRDDLFRPDGGVLEFDLSALDRGIDGYVWHFATHFGGRHQVSRGVYDFRGRRQGEASALREILDDALRARDVDETTARPKPYSERVFTHLREPAAKGSVVLVGEAAGLVDPVTGEGIAQAIGSARIAAAKIARDDLDASRYEAALAAMRCHRHLRQTAAVAPLVYGPLRALFARALVRCGTAVDAGVDWYAGLPVGRGRKLAAVSAFGAAFARAFAERAFQE